MTVSSTNTTATVLTGCSGSSSGNDNGKIDDDRFKLVPAHQRTFDSNWAEGVDLHNTFRYFSGEEMARLMGFPVAVPTSGIRVNSDDDVDEIKFRFPPDITLRQKWKLLGNSLNVTVAAKIVEVALCLSFDTSTIIR